jgi:phage gpG-like protein
MAQITFEVTGQKQLSRNLRGFFKEVTKMKQFNQAAIDLVEKRTDQIFKSKGAIVKKGPKWKPLSEATRKARSSRSGYYSRPPNKPSVLRWTGRLQSDRFKQATESEGVLRFNAPYAIYHQTGNSKLPKRPIIDVDNQTNAEIVRALQTIINKQIGVFGLQA